MTLSSFSRAALLLVAAASPSALSAQNAPAPKVAENPMSDSLAHARKLTKWFYAAQADSVQLFVRDEDRDQITPSAVMERLAQLTARAGTEVEVIEEKFVKRNGDTQYWRTAKFTLMQEPMLIRWALNPKGQIIGQGMGPLSSAPPIDP